MEFYLSKDKLSDKQLEIYEKLDSTPFGTEIAQLVADKLELTGRELKHSHRDYCGIGIDFRGAVFNVGEVQDGMWVHPVYLSFEIKSDFVSWLSKHSDQSMSLFGKYFNNQTITRIRLEWYLEDDYSPVWNSYCAYIRNKTT